MCPLLHSFAACVHRCIVNTLRDPVQVCFAVHKANRLAWSDRILYVPRVVKDGCLWRLQRQQAWSWGRPMTVLKRPLWHINETDLLEVTQEVFGKGVI